MIRQKLIQRKLFDFTRRKFIGGIILALLTSFCWYSFFYIARETMRIGIYWRTHHATYYEFLILTDEEVFFYNFIFALISSLFGLCTCFQFLFQRAKQYKEKTINYINRTAILTDISGVNSIFLHWFSRLIVIFAIISGMNQAWCYFQLYPAWNIFWALLIIVLFLEMFKTIRKVAFRESRQWLLFSAASIIVWSFLLSQIQLIDYKTLNNIFFNSSITRKYCIEYPESGYYRKIENISLTMDIHMCFPLGVISDSLPKIFVNQKESGFDNFYKIIKEKLEEYNEFDRRLITAVLHIDRQMPVKYVKLLQEHLSCSGLSRIGNKVFPADQGKCAWVYHCALIRMLPLCSNPELYPPDFPPLPPLQNMEGEYEQLPVQLTSDGLYINGKSQDMQDLDRSVRDFVDKHSNYLIVLNIDDNCDYESYVRIYSILFQTFYGLRDDLSITKYKQKFDDLSYEQQDTFKLVFPVAIYEQ